MLARLAILVIVLAPACVPCCCGPAHAQDAATPTVVNSSAYNAGAPGERPNATPRASQEAERAFQASTQTMLRALCGPGREPLARYVDREAARYRLRAAVLVAVIRTESTCDPRAIGRGGEIGLGQIRPGTRAARGYTEEQLLKPGLNLHATARHLHWALILCQDLAGGLSVYSGRRRCAASRYSKRVLLLAEEAEREP